MGKNFVERCSDSKAAQRRAVSGPEDLGSLAEGRVRVWSSVKWLVFSLTAGGAEGKKEKDLM